LAGPLLASAVGCQDVDSAVKQPRLQHHRCCGGWCCCIRINRTREDR
jgi:hypothetical protein